ncbi:MAG: hypothetical protein L0387_13980 [Acidobacteria bacterium]|nr:hypothetical protein [Acidobacteriota bacterium]
MTMLQFHTQDIPGLAHLSGPPIIDDRLKVVWFEDKETVGVSQQLIPYVQVTRLRVPESAEALLKAQQTIVGRGMKASRYELPECPHDIYIADHRLDEAPTNEVGEPSLARQAEACGLTTAVMMAASFPAHPATVIPYTAYKDQVKYQRDLLKRLCPGYVNVLWGNELGKLELGVARVLFDALIAHREFLVAAAGNGFIHLRLRERERMRAEIERSSTERCVWLAERVICLETEWGSRNICLGALWPELALAIENSPVDALTRAAILDWLEGFPVPTDEQLQARDLAYRYFWLSLSKESDARYRLAHILRSGVGPIGTTAANSRVREMCTEIGLDSDAVQAYVDAACNRREPVKIAIPPEWQAPHLLNAAKKEGLQESAVRLAVLCVLVCEEAARSFVREEIVEELPGVARELLSCWCRVYRMDETNIIDRLRELVSAYVRQDSPGDDENEVLGTITKLEALGAIAKLLEIGPSSVSGAALKSLLGLLERWAQSEKTAPLSATYVPRLIDPLPEQLGTADEDVAGDRVGKALMRIGFSKPTTLLFVGNGDQITPVERRVMHRFAMDLRFPKASWPGWMT